jgi:cytoskeletal protein CcmA (bactofilin family)
MKKLKLIILAAIIAAVPVAAGAALAHAQSFQTEVTPDQVVDSSIYSAGRSVDIHGTINGDVYCAGQNVVVDAVVHGDVLCAGQTILVSGQVDGSVRAAGQNITITAKIGRSLNAAGSDVVLTKNGSVGQDATLSGTTLTLEGPISRDVIIGSGGSVKLAGQIGRDVRFGGRELTLASGATVGGNLEYTSQQTAVISSGAKVTGKVTHSTPKREPHKPWGSLVGIGVFTLFMGLSFLLFDMVLALLFPQALHAVSGEALRAPLRVFLTGLVAAVVVPMVAIGLMFTVVGIPLALFGLLAWTVIAGLTGPVAAYYFGRMLLRQSTSPLLIMLLGAVVLMILFIVPFIGVLVALLAYLFGAGAILVTLGRVIPQPRYTLREAKIK